MDVSAPEILLGLFAIMCAVGVAYGSRWISRRSDAVLESTRLALRSGHAEPEMNRPAQVDAPAASSPAASSPAADAGEDLESTGRHRVPEELMRASTYLLSPDRIARARVPAPRVQNVPHPLVRPDN
jgi:hypothetical protein